MDQSALNLAHQYGRKAVSYYRKRRFDEAAEQHKKAADMLDVALAKIGNPRSLESLGTQQRYHTTQMIIALARKEQYEYLKKAMEIEKNAAIMLNKIGEKQESDMKLKLFNMLSMAESLINELASRKNFSDSDKSDTENNAIHALEELHQGPNPSDVKDSLTIVKELQDIIINVHSLVVNIANQLEESNNQREVLASEIDRLKLKQGASVKTAPKTVPQPSQATRKAEKVAMPNTSKMTETIVPKIESLNIDHYEPPRNICQLANFTELEIPERPPLPPLPPLEMPDIDYSMFISSTSLVPIPKRLLRNLNSDKNMPNVATSENNSTEAGSSKDQDVKSCDNNNKAPEESGESKKTSNSECNQS